MTEERAGKDPEFLPFIDVLRGIAILMVVVVHTSLSVPGLSPKIRNVAGFGQMGVQLFFLVSAYTLARSLTLRSDESSSLARYFIRRWFRIAPLYLCAIPLYAVMDAVGTRYVTGIWQMGPQYGPVGIIVNGLLMNGLFPRWNNSVVPGGWSVGTEVLFYLMLPALATAIARSGRTRWNCARWFAASLIFACACAPAVAAFAGEPILNNGFAYFFVVNQLPVFIAGLFAFYLEPKTGIRRATAANIVGCAVLSGAVLILLLREDSLQKVVGLPALSALAFWCLLNVARTMKASALRWVAACGTVSYSMYVCHFLFAYYGTVLVSEILTTRFSPPVVFVVCLTGSAAASYALARVTYAAVERPFVRLGKRLIARL